MLLLASACAGPALGADLSVKAPVLRVLQTYSGQGWYFGLGTFAEADKASVSGLAGQSVNAYAAGGAVDLTAAFMWGDGNTWKAIEISTEYMNIGSTSVGTAVPGAISSQWGFSECFLFGGPLASALQFLPNLGTLFPVLQPPTGSTTTHPYIKGCVHEKDVSASYMLSDSKVWQVNGSFGAGFKQQLGSVQPGNPAASQVTLDVGALYMIPGSGHTIGAPTGAIGLANPGGGARIYSKLEY